MRKMIVAAVALSMLAMLPSPVVADHGGISCDIVFAFDETVSLPATGSPYVGFAPGDGEGPLGPCSFFGVGFKDSSACVTQPCSYSFYGQNLFVEVD